MHRRHRHYSGSANGPTHDQQLEAEQIQSLIDQRIKEHLGGAGSQQVGAAFNQHLDSYPQRPCLPVMLPTGMPTHGSQMPEAEQTQSLITLIDRRIKDHLRAAGFQPAVIPGYGGQPLSPPPTVPGGTNHTSNGPPNPGAMRQGNPTTLVSGAVDGYNSNEDASVLQRPAQGSSTASSCLLNNERESSYLAEYVREAKNLDKGTTVRFGSWNVGSLTGKLREVVDTAARSGVNILCVQEIKWSGRNEAEVEDTGFRIWYRVGEKQYGAGILIDKSLKNRIFGVTRKAGIILVKLKVSDMVLNVISASAPQVGVSEDAKRKFWEDLNGLVRAVPSGEKLIIGGDFHGHIGTSREGFHRVHGGFGYGVKNQEGEEILNFATANDLMVANTFFRKKQSQIVTFTTGQYSSQINFFLARRRDRQECKDCKVIPGGCVVSQHKLLVSDFVFGAKTTWTKWWKLTEDAPRVFKDKTKAEGVTKIKDRTVAGGVTKIKDKTMAGVTKIKYRTMTEGVTKKRKKKNGRSMEDRRRSNQPSRADGDWHQKVAVESLGVTTKWARK